MSKHAQNINVEEVIKDSFNKLKNNYGQINDGLNYEKYLQNPQEFLNEIANKNNTFKDIFKLSQSSDELLNVDDIRHDKRFVTTKECLVSFIILLNSMKNE